MSKLLEWKESLRLHIHDFTRDLDMNDAQFLDEVYEKECLTDSDYEAIRSRKTNAEKARLLIVKIKDSAPPFIELFLQLLEQKQEYRHLAKKVRDTLHTIREENKSEVKCVICAMRECVEINDIADHLFTEGIISGDLYTDIVEQENLHGFRQYIWNEVIKVVNTERSKGIKTLKEAMGTKYKHVGDLLDVVPANTTLECCCVKRRQLRIRQMEDPFGSTTDISTTSEVPRTEDKSIREDTTDYGSDTDVLDDDTVVENLSHKTSGTDETVPVFKESAAAAKDPKESTVMEKPVGDTHGLHNKGTKPNSENSKQTNQGIQDHIVNELNRSANVLGTDWRTKSPQHEPQPAKDIGNESAIDNSSETMAMGQSKQHISHSESTDQHASVQNKSATDRSEETEHKANFSKIKHELRTHISDLKNKPQRSNSLPYRFNKTVIKAPHHKGLSTGEQEKTRDSKSDIKISAFQNSDSSTKHKNGQQRVSPDNVNKSSRRSQIPKQSRDAAILSKSNSQKTIPSQLNSDSNHSSSTKEDIDSEMIKSNNDNISGVTKNVSKDSNENSKGDKPLSKGETVEQSVNNTTNDLNKEESTNQFRRPRPLQRGSTVIRNRSRRRRSKPSPHARSSDPVSVYTDKKSDATHTFEPTGSLQYNEFQSLPGTSVYGDTQDITSTQNLIPSSPESKVSLNNTNKIDQEYFLKALAKGKQETAVRSDQLKTGTHATSPPNVSANSENSDKATVNSTFTRLFDTTGSRDNGPKRAGSLSPARRSRIPSLTRRGRAKLPTPPSDTVGPVQNQTKAPGTSPVSPEEITFDLEPSTLKGGISERKVQNNSDGVSHESHNLYGNMQPFFDSKQPLRVRNTDDIARNNSNLRRTRSMPTTEDFIKYREGRKRKHDLLSSKSRQDKSQRRPSVGAIRPVASFSDIVALV